MAQDRHFLPLHPRVSTVLLLTALGTVPPLALPTTAQAGEGDTFRPVLQYAYYRDDNLFRLADSTPGYAFGKSDSYQTLGVGADVDWKQGRQRVLLSALVSKTKFNKYTLLDFDGKDASLEWQWELGNQWKGKLGTKYNTTLGTYLDIVGLVSSVRTHREQYFNAAYRFHTAWTADARFSRQDQDYSTSSQARNNYTQDNLAAGVYYRGGEIERIGLELSTLDGNYPDRTTPGAATRYEANMVHLVANWRITGKSRLQGRIGHISRNDNRAGGGASGMNGRLDWEWIPGGKSLLNFAIYKELKNAELAGAESLDTTGVSARAAWQYSSKITFGATLSADNNTYNGIPQDEDVFNAGVNVTYSPWPGGDITLGLQRQKRDSNVTIREFDASMLTLSAVLRF